MIIKNKERTTIKVRLTDILYDDIDYSNLFKCIDNSNLMITNGHLFMRSYILYIIENNESTKNIMKIKEPFIDVKFIRLVFSVLNSSLIKKGKNKSNLICFYKIRVIIIKDYYNSYFMSI